MFLWVPLYKYKLYSTYGYLCTSISFGTPTRELNKYKSAISTSMCPTGELNKYKSAISTSMCSTGDLNKYKSVISTSMCISLLYEFMKNSDICYCISVTIICFPLSVNLSTGFNPCRYRGGRLRSSAYC